MASILNGNIRNWGYGVAGKRLKSCASVLMKYGISFPPLYAGTINIHLSDFFFTPTSPHVLYIPQSEIDLVAPGGNEWWKFIPVQKVNGQNIPAYIYRNTQNVHGDDGAELVTIDLRNNPKFALFPGSPIILELPDF